MNFLKSCSRGRRGLSARGDRGATAVEYGLMVAFIALVIIASVTAFGASLKGLFETFVATAGQGFDASILHVARSVEGPVAGEFARVLAEIQIGKSRGAAFTSLAARTKVAEVRTFVTALVQADRLGLPIGGVLREQSVQMRLVRRQRAEEKAQKVPVKILFPMLLCIFPALFIVIIGPGAIQMIDAFSGLN